MVSLLRKDFRGQGLLSTVVKPLRLIGFAGLGFWVWGSGFGGLVFAGLKAFVRAN